MPKKTTRTVGVEPYTLKDGTQKYSARWYCPDWTWCETALKAERKHCRGHKAGTSGFDNAEDARAAGYKAQNDMKLGGKSSLIALDDSATMDSVAQMWFASGPPRIKSPKTLEGYRGRWEAWKNRNGLVGMVPVTGVTKVHVAQWLGELREVGLSRSTMVQDLVVVRHILRYAVSLDLIPSDPSEGITVPESKQGDPEKTPRFTEEQVWEIADELAVLAQKEHDHARAKGRLLPYSRWEGIRVMVLLGAYTGLRMGELIGLRQRFLDRSVRPYVIDVGWQWDEDLKDFRRPKRKSMRPVPVAPELLHDLDQHLHGDPYAAHDHGLIFATGNGTPFQQSNLRKDWHRVLDYLELPRYRWHSLRSTTVDIWRDRGMEAEDVRDMLGHKDINVTMNTYRGTATAGHLSDVVARVSATSRDGNRRQAANEHIGVILTNNGSDRPVRADRLTGHWEPSDVDRSGDVIQLPI